MFHVKQKRVSSGKSAKAALQPMFHVKQGGFKAVEALNDIKTNVSRETKPISSILNIKHS